MADEAENLTLRVLQELREKMRARLDKVDGNISDLGERFTDLTQRVDGNTLTFNLVAGIVYDHEQRIEKLESR